MAKGKRALIPIALGAIFIFSAVAPAASAFVLQGHSPIVLLLTDPNSGQFGCNGVPTVLPCSSSASTWVGGVNGTLASSECPCNYSVSSTGVTTIIISNALAGPWTVTWFNTSASGSFTITAYGCPEVPGGDTSSGVSSGNHNEPGCDTFCPPYVAPGNSLCDPDDTQVGLVITLASGTVANTPTGGTGFTVNNDGSVSNLLVTNELPLGTLSAVAASLVGLAGVALWVRRRSAE